MKQFAFCITLLLSMLYVQTGISQQYIGVPKAHSHNDYEQKRPFELAYENNFASIEADIWLKGGVLCVAHDAKDISLDKTLENLYISKLNTLLKTNKGSPYSNSSELQLLIDIKSEVKSTLEALITLLDQYPMIQKCKKIKIIISGNRPVPKEYIKYPSFIYFDGRPSETYDKRSLKKIGLISDNYLKYSKWMGNGPLLEKDKLILRDVIEKSHNLNKPFRFWATPDNENSWNIFMELGVDYINTDKVISLAEFLSKKK